MLTLVYLDLIRLKDDKLTVLLNWNGISSLFMLDQCIANGSLVRLVYLFAVLNEKILPVLV